MRNYGNGLISFCAVCCACVTNQTVNPFTQNPIELRLEIKEKRTCQEIPLYLSLSYDFSQIVFRISRKVKEKQHVSDRVFDMTASLL